MNVTDAQYYGLSSEDEEIDVDRLSAALHAQLSFQSELQSSSDDEFQTKPTTVKRVSGVGVVVDLDEDDGWISDSDECIPVVLTNQGQRSDSRQVIRI